MLLPISRRHFMSLSFLITSLLTLTRADVDVCSELDHFNELTDSQHGFPSQSFRSSNIVAPIFHVSSWDPSNVDDAPYIFLGTVYGHMGAGPMILDARDLSLVYADQRYDNAYTSTVTDHGGSRFLIFWEGLHSRGHTNGHCLVYDQSYRLMYNVTALGAPDASLADMHEMNFTPDGNIIFSVYANIPYDCSPVGGPENALLTDSGFQEVDPVTNQVLFQWFASAHFDITHSFAQYKEAYGVDVDSGYDFFHINSIQKTSDGNYLISSRHLSSVALIDGKDGHPIWVLGGKGNQFRDLSDGTATNFGWQHDARFYHNQSHITLFDNHGEQTEPCEDGRCNSRGLHLEIDTSQMTARLVQEYFHPAAVNSGAMGGLQTLESGNVLVGWGYNPGFVEYTSNGTPVMDVRRAKLGAGFQADMFAYRVAKHHWRGTPDWPPSAAVDAPGGSTANATVYVSWNGATEVASWAVLAADKMADIKDGRNLIAESPRRGFETTIALGIDHARRYLAVAAISADGRVLGSTDVIDMKSGQVATVASNILRLRPTATSGLAAVGVMGASLGVFAAVVLVARRLIGPPTPAPAAQGVEYEKLVSRV